jgi:hypothetical protein
MTKIKYYFILGSENFLLKEEPLEEVLRERVQNFNKKKKALNFWIIPNPIFLKNIEFSELLNKVPQNCVTIISTDKSFITWLKLRIKNVASGFFEKTLSDNISPLKF